MIRRLVLKREIQNSDKHLDEHILFTYEKCPELGEL